MTFVVAILMTCGVLVYPIAVDIKRHGSDNILRRSAQDLARIPSIAEMLASAKATVDRVAFVTGAGGIHQRSARQGGEIGASAAVPGVDWLRQNP